MKYRQLRVVATGQWVDWLCTVAGDGDQANVFTVPAAGHQADIALALGLPTAALEVMDADADVRVGPLLSLPPPPPVPAAPFRTRITELLAIPRSDWTVAQYRELLQLVAQELIQ